MNGIAVLKEGKSFCETYVAPGFTIMELNCERSFCLTLSNGIFDSLEHDDFVGSDYTGGWDD